MAHTATLEDAVLCCVQEGATKVNWRAGVGNNSGLGGMAVHGLELPGSSQSSLASAAPPPKLPSHFSHPAARPTRTPACPQVMVVPFVFSESRLDGSHSMDMALADVQQKVPGAR